ncbi:MAG: undecaprenyl-diphosphate phosphatase [Oscillospiraceae bacterium]|nr:undecaprenyl-diphosphate phosphatase [Oscillospiraceae bacterium]MDE6934822.1 undecaprenyl-diphosphate phosphatase [Oscillospiraceae bacterium]
MTLLNALILGIIQGVAEFLPISSSGHLSIAQNLLGLGVEGTDDVFFDVLLHLGTLAAVFAAYWTDIREMVLEFFRMISDVAGGRSPQKIPPARRLIVLIVVGTLPLFLILPIKDLVEGLYSNTFFVGGALLVTGLLLYFCDRIRKGRKNERTVTMADVLVVGLGQAVATCPGISRSGMTISMGCFRGMERRFAVRFAFLLSIPAVLGANILQIKDVAGAGVDVKLLPAYILGVAAAAVSGYLSIRLVRMVADKGRFGAFACYCWAAGAITVVLSLLRAFNLLPWLNVAA